MKYTDMNNLPFRRGYYQYDGYSDNWRGAIVKLASINLAGGCNGLVVESTGKMGQYDKNGAKFSVLQLSGLKRVEEYEKHEKIKIDNIFEFNFK